MPSYMDLMLAELQQQRSEQARQHGELLTAITALIQATQRLEARLAQLQAQAQVQAEGQAPPPAEILQSRPGPGRWGGRILEVAKNAAKAILGKRTT